MSRWIKISSKKKPDVGQPCLVAYNVYGQELYMTAKHTGDGRFVGTGYYSNTINNVTHWQEIKPTK
jgi:hypothetical protein